MRKIVLIIIGIVIILVVGRFLFATAKFFPVLTQLLFNKDITLKKTNHNIHLLLLGTGGGDHEGPNLTDTVIFTSINPDKSTVTLVSIPRDLWVPDLQGKINTAYAIGEDKEKGSGKILVKAVVSKILNQQIDYVFRIDFAGFVKAVNEVGGLDLMVEREFDDLQYPIEENREDLCGHTLEEATEQIATMSPTVVFPCRYEHLHFDAGQQHMDGATALKFVRSRYAEGPEGTDFARSKRQEKVITAFKEKIFSLGTILNPSKIISLLTILQDSVDTDIKQDEIDDFIKLAQKMKTAKIQTAVVDSGDEAAKREGLLLNPPISEEFNMQWVLSPRAGSNNYSEIQTYISCMIQSASSSACLIKSSNHNERR